MPRIAKSEKQKRKETLVKDIESAMNRCNVTNKHLCERLGISEATWFRRKSECRFTVDELLDIASFLNVGLQIKIGSEQG